MVIAPLSSLISFLALSAISLFYCFKVSSVQLFIEGFLQGLSFFLTLIRGLVSEFLSSLPDILTAFPLSINLCFKIFNILMSLSVIKLQSVELLTSIFQEFSGIDAVSNSLLILSEENIVFDFDIFVLGDTKFSHTEVVFQFGNLMFITIHFSDIVLDIMTSW